MLIGGFLCARASAALLDEISKSDRARNREEGDNECGKCALSLVGLGLSCTGLVLWITGAGMLLFWLLGGFLLGFYFTFSSATVLEDLAVVKLFGVVFAALSTTISTLVS